MNGETSSAAFPATPIERIIQGRVRDLGGFTVQRLLPAIERRTVGPFIFFDHFGPVEIPPGKGFDVRPHPHIALATVTYLFEGEIVHRDSLGTEQAIQPGAVNWMFAGTGIVHSERLGDQARREGLRMAGIQSWIALPKDREDDPPRFEHHPAATLPHLVNRDSGTDVRVLLGSAYGLTSPVTTLSPTFYVDVQLSAGAEIELPLEYSERAAYVAEGSVTCDGHEALTAAQKAPELAAGTLELLVAGELVVFRAQRPVTLRATRPSRVLLLGGEPLDGERHVWWNFVSSSGERIEAAKHQWKEGRFPKVPGDESEFIPLPE